MSRKSRVAPDSEVSNNSNSASWKNWSLFPRSNKVATDSHLPNSSKVVPLNVLSESQINDINEKIRVLNAERELLNNNWHNDDKPIKDENYLTRLSDIDKEINELQIQISESIKNKELSKHTQSLHTQSFGGKLRKSKKIKKSKRKTRIRYKNRKSKKH
jgi:hypothetical protein